MEEAIVALEQTEETSIKNTTFRKTIKRYVLEGALYLAAFLVVLVLFWTIKPLMEVQYKGAVAQAVAVIGIAFCVVFVAYMGMAKRLTVGKITVILLIIGFLLRVGYMLYTPAAARQQDTFTKNFDGHEAYAWTLFDTGKLPTTNKYQFYHPPLNAMVQAAFMKLMSAFSAGVSSLFELKDYFPAKFQYARPSYITDEMRYYLFSSCQVLTVMYSFLAAVVQVKTIGLFSFSGKTKLLITAIVVLYPRQIQFSGMLNNDGISYFLGVLAMYYALKWQKQGKRPVWIVLCALSVGLGMMAKLSSATVCLPIAGVFLYEFVMTLRKKEQALSFKKMVVQYGVFLLLCAPIGLWFQIYANVRFDQEFGHVFSNLNKKLYTGDHSFFSRFIFALDWSEYFGSLYCRPFEGNYFLFNYALRSSIFGEFSYWRGEGFAAAAILFAYLSVVLVALGLVWSTVLCIAKRKKEGSLLHRAELSFADLLFVFLLVQSQVLSEVYFYIQMPYGCTMDFRYIMPFILGIALLVGCTQKIMAMDGGRVSTVLNRITTISVIAFLTVSSLFYCVCI